jgi:hypothetical protein
MRKWLGVGLGGLLVLVALSGCTLGGGGGDVKKEPEKKAEAAVASTPATSMPTPLSVEEQQARREMEAALLRDAREYYKRVMAKDVDGALELVVPEGRKVQQGKIWAFLSQYRVESSDLISQEIYFRGTPEAKVKMGMTVFSKRAVVPEKQEEILVWIYRDGRWLVRVDS